MARGNTGPMVTDPAIALVAEYRRVAKVMFDEVSRHEQIHGCRRVGTGCDLRMELLTAWQSTHQMAEALEWVVLGQPPPDSCGYAQPRWVAEYFHGPWRKPPPPPSSSLVS